MPADKRYTVEGYWDCQYCGQKAIRGRFSSCPSCGHARDKSVRFYVLDADEAHAISREEFAREQDEARHNSRSDSANYSEATTSTGPSLYDRREGEGTGDERDEHDASDWYCDYCDSYNPATVDHCLNCGAAREQTEGKTYADEMGQVARTYDAQGNLVSERDLSHRAKPQVETKPTRRTPSGVGRFLCKVGIVVAVLVALGILGNILFPSSKKIEVGGFSWVRTIAIEELKTVSEDGWSVPAGGRTTNTRTEVRDYRQVLDHYEMVEYQVPEQVLDHYETYTTQVDNGDGTFDVEEHSEPVYRTEYRTETRQEPVYVAVPIYDTKYYYDIEKWVHTRDVTTAGEDHDPYWGEVTLAEATGEHGTGEEREGTRSGTYYVVTSEGDRYTADEDFWASLEAGEELTVRLDGSHIAPKED